MIAKSGVRIAVILPVYNGESYLAAAIRSILTQSFRDFELTVIDDGSTDRTPQILRSFSDRRMRIIRFEENRGLIAALNVGIRETQSEFIARMDSDDISVPARFQLQIDFMKANPEVGLCGTWARSLGSRRCRRPPVDPEGIRARLFFRSAMDHPSLMMRRNVIDKHCLYYDTEFVNVEDFELLTRAAAVTKLANLPKDLLLYREHDGQVTARYRRTNMETQARLLVRQLRSLTPEVNFELEEFHIQVARGSIPVAYLPRAEAWLHYLNRTNREYLHYDVAAFQNELSRQWFRLHATSRRWADVISYWQSPLRNFDVVGLREFIAWAKRFVVSAVVH